MLLIDAKISKHIHVIRTLIHSAKMTYLDTKTYNDCIEFVDDSELVF